MYLACYQKGGGDARGIVILDLNRVFFSSLPFLFSPLNKRKSRAVQVFYRHDKFQYSNAAYTELRGHVYALEK